MELKDPQTLEEIIRPAEHMDTIERGATSTAPANQHCGPPPFSPYPIGAPARLPKQQPRNFNGPTLVELGAVQIKDYTKTSAGFVEHLDMNSDTALQGIPQNANK